MRTLILGFGRSAVPVIIELHSLFGYGVAAPASSALARRAALAIDDVAEAPSLLVGQEFGSEAHEAADYVILIVDPSDSEALRDATIVVDTARCACSGFTLALCSEPVMDDDLDATVQSAKLQSLRGTVDSLVVVKAGHRGDTSARITRVAYTLVAAPLGHRVNLIGLDLGDLKEALRGCAVAAVTRTDLSDTKMTGHTTGLDGHIDLTPTLAGNPRGLFCSYGAPPDRLRLEDFESVGSVIHEALQLVYPMHDLTIVPACLADSSLDRVSEVVTCLAFDS